LDRHIQVWAGRDVDTVGHAVRVRVREPFVHLPVPVIVRTVTDLAGCAARVRPGRRRAVIEGAVTRLVLGAEARGAAEKEREEEDGAVAGGGGSTPDAKADP
jgi:hypothetical protein